MCFLIAVIDSQAAMVLWIHNSYVQRLIWNCMEVKPSSTWILQHIKGKNSLKEETPVRKFNDYRGALMTFNKSRLLKIIG